MYKIVEKQVLSPNVKRLSIQAPEIAAKALPGQFIMLRVHEGGERIPLTISECDTEKGSVSIIFQEVGKTTQVLGALNEGDEIINFVGPLGVPSHLDGVKKAIVIGGGLGTAIAFPQAKALFEAGAQVDVILGFRTQELVMLENEMGPYSTNLYVTTDDGTYGQKGFVTDVLKQLLEKNTDYDMVIAIGPLIMMKMVCAATKPYGIKTIVSMNPIMVDGTGMCGCCRVTVGGKTRFACVDGPDFDGHLVDFDEAMRRTQMYRAQETQSLGDHKCKLQAQVAE